ncbi:MAG: thioredoxin domain-containing protein [Brevinematales bacterium]|jgi:thioredoxin
MVEKLDAKSFKSLVFDFEAVKEWKYSGSMPCVIDFYADWCGPCRMVAPILEDLSGEFDMKVKVYKVNTDHEQDLAVYFDINTIPSILFVPMEGKPRMVVGALSRSTFRKGFEMISKSRTITGDFS